MRKIWRLGTIGAVAIIVLAGISTCVGAQEISIKKEINLIVSMLKSQTIIGGRVGMFPQLMKEKEMNWQPGWFLSALGGLIIWFVVFLIGFWIQLPV